MRRLFIEAHTSKINSFEVTILKRVAIYTALLLFPLFSISQADFSVDEYLLSAISDEAVTLHQKQIDFLRNSDYDLPIAKQLEFRTETDEMDFGRQEYLMRFRHTPKKERKAHKKIHESNIQAEEVEQQILIEEALMDHYFYTIKYFSLLKEIDLLKQQKAVADDILYVLKRKATNNANVNLNELFSAETEVHKLEQDILEKNGEIEILTNIIKKPLGTKRSSVNLDTSQIISIAELRNKINQLSSTSTVSPVFLKRQLAIENNQLDFDFDQVKNDWKIDYVQIKYSGREKLNFARELSIGAGVEIPLKNQNKLDKNDYMLDKIELENRLALQKNNFAKRIEKTQEELNLKFKQYDLLNQQLSNSQVQYSSKTYSRTSGADPVLILNIKANILDRKSNQLNIEEDIYRLYLDLLEISGKAAIMPLKNYLTADWRSIK